MGDQRAKGKKWFDSLSYTDKWALGDELVWGCIDWHEWGFAEKPSAAFRNAVDEARIHWEIMLKN